MKIHFQNKTGFMFRRMTAAALAVCFTATSVQAAPPLSMAPASPAGFSAPSLAGALEIPEAAGTVLSRHEAGVPGAPALILIQDAHAHADAQQNTRRILKHLKQAYGINHIFVEGAFGRLDPAHLNFFPQPELNQQAADLMAQEGLIGGPELFLFDEQQSKKSAQAWGIEDPALYRRNLRLYRRVLSAENETREFIGSLKAAVLTAGSRRFGSDLQDFFREWVSFQERGEEWQRHLGVLADAARRHLDTDLSHPRAQIQWPQLVRVYKMQELEKNLSAAQVEKEQADLIRWIRRSGLEAFEKQLTGIAESGTYSAGRETVREILQKFYTAARPLGFGFDQYPSWTRLAGRAVLEDEIRAEALLAEIEKITGLVLDRLARTAEEKALVQLYRDAVWAGSLFALELVPEEYAEAQKRIRDLRPSALNTHYLKIVPAASLPRNDETITALDKVFDRALSFYAVARKREDAMLARIVAGLKQTGQSRAVLIAGGFHTPGLTARFRKAGFSYAVVSPRIAAFAAGEDKTYRSLMTLDADRQTLRSELRAFSRLESLGGVILNQVGALEAQHAAMGINSVISRIASVPKRGWQLKGINGSPAFQSHGLHYRRTGTDRSRAALLLLKNRPVVWKNQWVGMTANGPRFIKSRPVRRQPFARRSEVRSVEPVEIQLEPGADAEEIVLRALETIFSGEEKPHVLKVKGSTALGLLGSPQDPAWILANAGFAVTRDAENSGDVRREFWNEIKARLLNPRQTPYKIELVGTSKIRIHWDSPFIFRGVPAAGEIVLEISRGSFSQKFQDYFRISRRNLPGKEMDYGPVRLPDEGLQVLGHYLQHDQLALEFDFKLPSAAVVEFTAGIPDDGRLAEVNIWLDLMTYGRLPGSRSAQLISEAEQKRLEQEAERLETVRRREAEAALAAQQAAEKAAVQSAPQNFSAPDFETEIRSLIDEMPGHRAFELAASNSNLSRRIREATANLHQWTAESHSGPIDLEFIRFQSEQDVEQIRQRMESAFRSGADLRQGILDLAGFIFGLSKDLEHGEQDWAGKAQETVRIVNGIHKRKNLQRIIQEFSAVLKAVEKNFIYAAILDRYAEALLQTGYAFGILSLDDLRTTKTRRKDYGFRRLPEAAPRHPVLWNRSLNALKEAIQRLRKMAQRGGLTPARFLAVDILAADMLRSLGRLAELPDHHPLTGYYLDLLNLDLIWIKLALRPESQTSDKISRIAETSLQNEIGRFSEKILQAGIADQIENAMLGLYAANGWARFPLNVFDENGQRGIFDVDEKILRGRRIPEDVLPLLLTNLPSAESLTASGVMTEDRLEEMMEYLLAPVYEQQGIAPAEAVRKVQSLIGQDSLDAHSFFWQMMDYFFTVPAARPLAEKIAQFYFYDQYDAVENMPKTKPRGLKDLRGQWEPLFGSSDPSGRSEVRSVETLEIELAEGQKAEEAVLAAAEKIFGGGGDERYILTLRGATPLNQLGQKTDPVVMLREMAFAVNRTFQSAVEAEKDFWKYFTDLLKDPAKTPYKAELIGTNRIRIYPVAPLSYQGAVIGDAFELILSNAQFSENFVKQFKAPKRLAESPENGAIVLSPVAVQTLTNYIQTNRLVMNPDFHLPESLPISFEASIPDEAAAAQVREWMDLISDGKFPGERGSALVSAAEKRQLDEAERAAQAAEEARLVLEAQQKRLAAEAAAARSARTRIDFPAELNSLLESTFEHPLVKNMLSQSREVANFNKSWLSMVRELAFQNHREVPDRLPLFDFGIENDFDELQRLARSAAAAEDPAPGLRVLLSRILALYEAPSDRYLDYVSSTIAPAIVDISGQLKLKMLTSAAGVKAYLGQGYLAESRRITARQLDSIEEMANAGVIYQRMMLQLYDGIFRLGYQLDYLNDKDRKEITKLSHRIMLRQRKLAPAAEPLPELRRQAIRNLKEMIRTLEELFHGIDPRFPLNPKIMAALPSYVSRVADMTVLFSRQLRKIESRPGHPLTGFYLDLLYAEYLVLQMNFQIDAAASLEMALLNKFVTSSGFWEALGTALSGLYAAHGWMLVFALMQGTGPEDTEEVIGRSRVIQPEAEEEILRLLPQVTEMMQAEDWAERYGRAIIDLFVNAIYDVNPEALRDAHRQVLQAKPGDAASPAVTFMWELTDFLFTIPEGRPVAEKFFLNFLKVKRSEVRQVELLKIALVPGQDAEEAVLQAAETIFGGSEERRYTLAVTGSTRLEILGRKNDPARILAEMGFAVARDHAEPQPVEDYFYQHVRSHLENRKEYPYTVELLGSARLRIHWEEPLRYYGKVIGSTTDLELDSGQFSESFQAYFKPRARLAAGQTDIGPISLPDAASKTLSNYLHNRLKIAGMKLPADLRIPFEAVIPDEAHRAGFLEWISIMSDEKYPAGHADRLVAEDESARLAAEAARLEAAKMPGIPVESSREPGRKRDRKSRRPAVRGELPERRPQTADIRSEISFLIDQTVKDPAVETLQTSHSFDKTLNTRWRSIRDSILKATRKPKDSTYTPFHYEVEKDIADIQAAAQKALAGEDLRIEILELLKKIIDLNTQPLDRYLDFSAAILNGVKSLNMYRHLMQPLKTPSAEGMDQMNFTYDMITLLRKAGGISEAEHKIHYRAVNAAVIYSRLLKDLYHKITFSAYALGVLNESDMAALDGLMEVRGYRRLPAAAEPLAPALDSASQLIQRILEQVRNVLQGMSGAQTNRETFAANFHRMEVYWSLAQRNAGHPLSALYLDWFVQSYISFNMHMTIDAQVNPSLKEAFEAISQADIWAHLWIGIAGLYASHGWGMALVLSNEFPGRAAVFDLDHEIQDRQILSAADRQGIRERLSEASAVLEGRSQAARMEAALRLLLAPALQPAKADSDSRRRAEFQSMFEEMIGIAVERNIPKLSTPIMDPVWEMTDFLFTLPEGREVAEKILVYMLRSEMRTQKEGESSHEHFTDWNVLRQEIIRRFSERSFSELAITSGQDFEKGVWQARVDLKNQPARLNRQPEEYLNETLDIMHQDYLAAQTPRKARRSRVSAAAVSYQFELRLIKPEEEGQSVMLAIIYSPADRRSEVRVSKTETPSADEDLPAAATLAEIQQRLEQIRAGRAAYESTLRQEGLPKAAQMAARMNLTRATRLIGALETRIASMSQLRDFENNRRALLLALELQSGGLEDPPPAVLANYLNLLEVAAADHAAVTERARRFAAILERKTLIRNPDEMAALLSLGQTGLILDPAAQTYSLEGSLQQALENFRQKIRRPSAPAVRIETPKVAMTLTFRHEHALSEDAENRIQQLIRAYFTLHIYKKEILKAGAALQAPSLEELTGYLQSENSEWTEGDVLKILHDIAPQNTDGIRYEVQGGAVLQPLAENPGEFGIAAEDFEEISEYGRRRLQLRIKWVSQVVPDAEPAGGVSFEEVQQFFEDAKGRANDGWKFFYLLLEDQPALWSHLTNYLSGAEFNPANLRHRNRLIEIYNRIKEREFAWRAYEKLYLGEPLSDDLTRQILEDPNQYFLRFLYRLRDFYSEEDFFRSEFFRRAVARIIAPPGGFVNGHAHGAPEADWLDREQTRRQSSSQTPILEKSGTLIRELLNAEQALQNDPKNRELRLRKNELAKQLRLIMLRNAFALADFQGEGRGQSRQEINEAILEATGAESSGTIVYWRNGKKKGGIEEPGHEAPSIAWPYFAKLAAFAMDHGRGHDSAVKAAARLLDDETLTAREISLIFPKYAAEILSEGLPAEDPLPPAVQAFTSDLQRHSEKSHTEEVVQRFFGGLFEYARAYEGQPWLNEVLPVYVAGAREMLQQRKEQLLAEKFDNIPSEASEAHLNHRIGDYLERPLLAFMSEESTLGLMMWDPAQEDVPPAALRKITNRLDSHLNSQEPAYHVLKELALMGKITLDQLTILAFVAAHQGIAEAPDPGLERLRDALISQNVLPSGRSREKATTLLQTFYFKDAKKADLIHRTVAYLRSLDWRKSFYTLLLDEYGQEKPAHRRARGEIDMIVNAVRDLTGSAVTGDSESLTPEDAALLRALLHDAGHFMRHTLRHTDQPEAVIRRLMRIAHRLENVFDRSGFQARHAEVAELPADQNMLNLARWMNEGLEITDLQAFLYQRGYRLEGGVVQHMVSGDRLARQTTVAAEVAAQADQMRRTDWERRVEALVLSFFSHRTSDYDSWENFRDGLISHVRNQYSADALEEMASIFGKKIADYLAEKLGLFQIDPIGFYLKKAYDELEKTASALNRETLYQAVTQVLEGQHSTLTTSRIDIGNRLAHFVGLGLNMRERLALTQATRAQALHVLEPDSQAAKMAALYFDLLDSSRGVPPNDYRMRADAQKRRLDVNYMAVLDETNTALRESGLAPLLITRRKIKNFPADIFQAWKSGVIKADNVNLRDLTRFLSRRVRVRKERAAQSLKGKTVPEAQEEEWTLDQFTRRFLDPEQGLVSQEYEEDLAWLEAADPAFSDALNVLMEAVEQQAQVMEEHSREVREQHDSRQMAEDRDYTDAEIQKAEAETLQVILPESGWALDSTASSPEKYIQTLVAMMEVTGQFVGSEKLLNLVLARASLTPEDLKVAWAYWRAGSRPLPRLAVIQRLLADQEIVMDPAQILQSLERLNEYTQDRLAQIIFVTDKTHYLSEAELDGEDRKLAAIYRAKVVYPVASYEDFIRQIRRERAPKNVPDVEQILSDPDFVREIDDRLKWKLGLSPRIYNVLQSYRILGGFAKRDVGIEDMIQMVRQRETADGRSAEDFDREELEDIAVHVNEVLDLELKWKQAETAAPVRSDRKLIGLMNPHDYYHDLGFTDEELDQGLPSQKSILVRMKSILDHGSHKHGDGELAWNAWQILKKGTIQLRLLYQAPDGKITEELESHAGKARYDEIYLKFRDRFKASRSEVRAQDQRDFFENWKNLTEEVLSRFKEGQFARLAIMWRNDSTGAKFQDPLIVDLSEEPRRLGRDPEEYLQETLESMFNDKIRPSLPAPKIRRKNPPPAALTDLGGVTFTLYAFVPPAEYVKQFGEKPVLIIVADKPAVRSEVRSAFEEAVIAAERVPLLAAEGQYAQALEYLQAAMREFESLGQSLDGASGPEADAFRHAAEWNLGLLRQWGASIQQSKDAEDLRRLEEREKKTLLAALTLIRLPVGENKDFEAGPAFLKLLEINPDDEMVLEIEEIANVLSGRSLMTPSMMARLDEMAEFGLLTDEASQSFTLEDGLEAEVQTWIRKNGKPAAKRSRRASAAAEAVTAEPAAAIQAETATAEISSAAAVQETAAADAEQPGEKAAEPDTVSEPEPAAAESIPDEPVVEEPAAVVPASVFTLARMQMARTDLLKALTDPKFAGDSSLDDYLIYLRMIFFDAFPEVRDQPENFESHYNDMLNQLELSLYDLRMIWVYWQHSAGLPQGEVLEAAYLRDQMRSLLEGQTLSEREIIRRLDHLNHLLARPVFIVDANRPESPSNPAAQIVALEPDLYGQLGYSNKEISRFVKEMPSKTGIESFYNGLSINKRQQVKEVYHLLRGDMGLGGGMDVTVTYGNRRREIIRVMNRQQYNELYERWLPHRRSEVRSPAEVSLFEQARRLSEEGRRAQTEGELDEAVNAVKSAHRLMAGLAEEGPSASGDVVRRAALWNRGMLEKQMEDLESRRRRLDEQILILALAAFQRQRQGREFDGPAFIESGLNVLRIQNGLRATMTGRAAYLLKILQDIEADEAAADAEFREWTPEDMETLERLEPFGLVLNPESMKLEISPSLAAHAAELEQSVQDEVVPAKAPAALRPKKIAEPVLPAVEEIRVSPAPEPAETAAPEIISKVELNPLPAVLEQLAQSLASADFSAEELVLFFQALRSIAERAIAGDEEELARLMGLPAEISAERYRNLRRLLGMRGYGEVEIIKDILADRIARANLEKNPRTQETAADFIRAIDVFRRLARRDGQVSPVDFSENLTGSGRSHAQLALFRSGLSTAGLSDHSLVWDFRDIPHHFELQRIDYDPAPPASPVRIPVTENVVPPAKPAAAPAKSPVPDTELEDMIRAYRAVWYRDGGDQMKMVHFAEEYDGSRNGSNLMKRLERKLDAQNRTIESLVRGLIPLSELITRWVNEKSSSDISLSANQVQKMIQAYRKIRLEQPNARFPNAIWGDEADLGTRDRVAPYWQIFVEALQALGHAPEHLEKGIIPALPSEIFEPEKTPALKPTGPVVSEEAVQKKLVEDYGFSPETAALFSPVYRLFARYSAPGSTFLEIDLWVQTVRQDLALAVRAVPAARRSLAELNNPRILEKIWSRQVQDPAKIHAAIKSAASVLRLKDKNRAQGDSLHEIDPLSILILRQMIFDRLSHLEPPQAAALSQEFTVKILDLIKDLPFIESEISPDIRNPFTLRFRRIEGWIYSRQTLDHEKDLAALTVMLHSRRPDANRSNRPRRDDERRGGPRRHKRSEVRTGPGLSLRHLAVQNYGLADERPVLAVARASRWIYPEKIAAVLGSSLERLLPSALAAQAEDQQAAWARGVMGLTGGSAESLILDPQFALNEGGIALIHAVFGRQVPAVVIVRNQADRAALQKINQDFAARGFSRVEAAADFASARRVLDRILARQGGQLSGISTPRALLSRDGLWTESALLKRQLEDIPFTVISPFVLDRLAAGLGLMDRLNALRAQMEQITRSA